MERDDNDRWRCDDDAARWHLERSELTDAPTMTDKTNKTDKTDSVYARLQAVRVMLSDSDIKKSGQNRHLGFAYYELDDFIPKAMKQLCNHRLCGVFNLYPDHASLTIVDADRPDDRIEFTMPTAQHDNPKLPALQAVGSLQTYLRRYLWRQALELAESDPTDSTAGTLYRDVAALLRRGKAKEAAELLVGEAAGDTDLKRDVWGRFTDDERKTLSACLPGKAANDNPTAEEQ